MSVAQKFSRPKFLNVSCTFLAKIEHLFLSLDLSVQLMIQLNTSNCAAVLCPTRIFKCDKGRSRDFCKRAVISYEV